MSSSTSAPADLTLVRTWCDQALQALGVAREEIDALNVYPVPDGDTGTNLYLTFEAARDALREADFADPMAALEALGRGALLGARGNSGVILSQLLRAGAETLAAARSSRSGRPARVLADILVAAADAGYAAVGTPVEGTILTVAREAGEAARQAAEDTGALADTITAAATAAREALQRTPDQLPALAAAGVVDAGGRGLCVLFDVAETLLTGVHRAGPVVRRRPVPVAAGSSAGSGGGGLNPGGPSSEVMFLLDAEDAAIPLLRDRLSRLGDSLVVVGGDGLWNVHVHVDEVGAAIEAGIEAGRPHRIRVTHFADQIQRRPHQRHDTRGVVVVAAGPGLAALFEAAGAEVVTGGPGRRCSTAEILVAVRATSAAEVVVLPNDADSLAVAEAAAQAAREEGIRVAVVPTRAQVQGLAALAVHDAARSFDDDVVAMTAAGGHARHGAVTIAARDAITTAGPCAAGDALGVVEGDFAVVGHSLPAVAAAVVGRLLGGGGEMVTLVRGHACDDALVDDLVSHLRATRPDVDAVVYDGGQERYPLLIAVE
ncbi:MAG TPA: DAK2 domain-containing protein [Nocardioidaceae bacterium]|nr:DAK2 domain-containing protein [Nocardioidaceae bacterium]